MKALWLAAVSVSMLGCKPEERAPVVKGLQLSLTTSSKTVVQGEDVTFSERAENVSGKTIHGNFHHWSREVEVLEDYYVTLLEEDDPLLRGSRLNLPLGDRVSSRGPGAIDNGELVGFPLAGGSSSHYSTSILPGGCRTETYTFRPMRSGVYRFRAQWSSSWSADHQADLWKGDLQSNWVTLDVKPHRELHELASGLELTVRPKSTSFKPGETVRIGGTLRNAGSAPVILATNVSSLQILSYTSMRESQGTGCGGYRTAKGIPIPVKLMPGAIALFEAEDLVPAMLGTLKIRCGLAVFLKIDGKFMGTAVYADCPRSISVSTESRD